MQPRLLVRCANVQKRQVKPMRIQVEGLTDIGKCRDNNEDSLWLDEKQQLYIVADGVGGQPAGEVASHLVVERLPDILATIRSQTETDAGAQLDQAVQAVNKLLLEASVDRPEWKGMSTTLVAAWLRSGEVTLANIGDSRAYLLRDQGIEQLSEDHTVLADQQRLGLPDDGSSAGMAHVLTRCLGLEDEVEVCVGSFPVHAGDRLLLCSDGLTDSLSEEVIRSVVLSTGSPGEGCRMLIELANRNGGRDNITVLLIYFDEATLKSRISNLLGRRS